MGSSTLEFFDLDRAFKGAPTLNRGIGDEPVAAMARRLDATLERHAPRAVVLYARAWTRGGPPGPRDGGRWRTSSRMSSGARPPPFAPLPSRRSWSSESPRHRPEPVPGRVEDLNRGLKSLATTSLGERVRLLDTQRPPGGSGERSPGGLDGPGSTAPERARLRRPGGLAPRPAPRSRTLMRPAAAGSSKLRNRSAWPPSAADRFGTPGTPNRAQKHQLQRPERHPDPGVRLLRGERAREGPVRGVGGPGGHGGALQLLALGLPMATVRAVTAGRTSRTTPTRRPAPWGRALHDARARRRRRAAGRRAVGRLRRARRGQRRVVRHRGRGRDGRASGADRAAGQRGRRVRAQAALRGVRRPRGLRGSQPDHGRRAAAQARRHGRLPHPVPRPLHPRVDPAGDRGLRVRACLPRRHPEVRFAPRRIRWNEGPAELQRLRVPAQHGRAAGVPPRRAGHRRAHGAREGGDLRLR